MRAVSRYIIVIAIVTILFAFLPPPRTAHAGTASEATIRQQVVSLLQSGGRISDIPPTHTLYPLRKAPLTAIVSYLVMEEDPSMMERFFPVIRKISLDNFRDDAVTRQMLIKGSSIEAGKEPVALSPSVNSLAAIDLHALSLIAFGAEKYEEAIELHIWAKQLSLLTENTFYDHSMNAFFPISAAGKYVVTYTPELLLPMINDRILGKRKRVNVADRLIHNMKTGQGIPCTGGTMWDDPSLRPFLFDMLSNIHGLPVDRLQGLYEIQSGGAGHGSYGNDDAWIRFWKKEGRTSSLFRAGTSILSLTSLSAILQREDVLKDSKTGTLYEDIDSLQTMLGAARTDLDRHVASIELVNRILVKVGNLHSILESNEKLWSILNEPKWNSISPRTRKLIKQACTESVDELMDAKVLLSALMMESTGIEASAGIPEKPVRIGDPVPVEISMKSMRQPIEIRRLYFQVSGTRWTLTDSDSGIRLGTAFDDNRWKRNLMLPPSSQPGLLTLPMFVDFIYQGRRTEIHLVESVTLTRKYDLALEFLKGRRLTDDEPVPLNILIKYRPEQRLQGSVDGAFLENMACTPELPARFVIDPETEITTLPLKLSLSGVLSPGRYPFSISVQLGGQRIALFEEELLKPIDWLHLGPVKNRRWALEEAVQLQDDLYNSYTSPDGRTLRWTNVAPGAVDSRGAVLPDRLYGSGSESAMLLYTAFDLKTMKKVKWQISSSNVTSFWINSIAILSGAGGSESYSGTATLKKGHNSILISSYWQGKPSPVLLSISDESGLPVPGLANRVDVISSSVADVRTYHPKGPEHSGHNHTREVVLRLNYPGAKEVSVIAEFNNWSPKATPMTLNRDGDWEAVLDLPRGKYHYRFFVDNKKKITDPSNTNSEPDGFGGYNSILIVK